MRVTAMKCKHLSKTTATSFYSWFNYCHESVTFLPEKELDTEAKGTFKVTIKVKIKASIKCLQCILQFLFCICHIFQSFVYINQKLQEGGIFLQFLITEFWHLVTTVCSSTRIFLALCPWEFFIMNSEAIEKKCF